MRRSAPPDQRAPLSASFAALSEDLAKNGLSLRGGFDFGPDEDAPPGPSGPPARSVILIGNAGGACWPKFRHWQKTQAADLPNPLDTWSREIIGAVAQSVGARAVSPSDRPYLPFQQWAMRAEGLRPSPLGVLMHPRFGVWHAYRGALLFDHEIEVADLAQPEHLCDSCIEKPCLSACPIGAHSLDGFAYHACVDFVRRASGGDCRDQGCLDRNACPVGTDYRYPVDMQVFFMKTFAGL